MTCRLLFRVVWHGSVGIVEGVCVCLLSFFFFFFLVALFVIYDGAVSEFYNIYCTW